MVKRGETGGGSNDSSSTSTNPSGQTSSTDGDEQSPSNSSTPGDASSSTQPGYADTQDAYSNAESTYAEARQAEQAQAKQAQESNPRDAQNAGGQQGQGTDPAATNQSQSGNGQGGNGQGGGGNSQGGGGNGGGQGSGGGEEGFFESLGGGVGTAAGASAGAGAGTLAGPVGTIGGGVLGGMAGEQVGSAVGGAVDDGIGWAGDTLSDAGSWLQDNAGSIADGALKVANPIGGLAFEEITDGGFSALQEKQQAAEERAGNFEKAKQTLESGGAVNLSDELLDPARQGLDLFEQFLPLYKEWNGSGPDFEPKVVKEYDQVREIDFGAFRADAERLTSVQSGLGEQNESMDHTFRGTKETWKGEASESASGKVQSYNQAGASVIQDAEAFAGAIVPAVDGIQEAVREYAKFVLDLAPELKCAGKTPDETKDEIRKANGDIRMEDLTDVGIDDVFSGAWSTIKGTAIGFICGGPIGGLFGELLGAKDAADDIRQGLIDDAKKWLDGSFIPEMRQKYGQFQERSGAVQETVQASYDTMLQAAEAQDDPFKGMRDGGEGDRAAQPSAENTPTSQPAPGDTGGGGTGGGGTGGGGAGGGGAPETPEVPESPEMDGPEEPGSGPGEQGQPDEVTLGKGDDAVTVQEPNEQGTTEVTVIGEDGQPKTYDVSFGPEGGPGEPGAAPGPGGQPPPGQSPGQATGQTPGQPGMGTMPAPADGAAAPGGPQSTPIQADENGKAVIQDGGRTITLERGPDGGMQVEIDNGGGEPPTSQTINFGDDSPVPSTGIGEGEPPPQVGGFEESVPSTGIGEGEPPPQVGGFEESVPSTGIGEGEPPPQVGGFDSPGESAAASSTGGMTADAGSGTGFPGAAGEAAGEPGNGAAPTTPQSSGMTSMGGLGEGAQNSFGSASGQLQEDGASSRGPSSEESSGAPGMASMGGPESGSPQGAGGMASMGDSGGQSGQGSGGTSGGGMMGGMGGMGGQQQGGGEQERSNDSPWRTQGQLFDDGIDPSNVRYRSVLGEDGEK